MVMRCFPVKLFDFGKLQRVVCFYFVAFIDHINNQGKHKAGKQGADKQVQGKPV